LQQCVPTMARAAQVASFLETSRLMDMHGSIRCSSLTPGREEHLTKEISEGHVARMGRSKMYAQEVRQTDSIKFTKWDSGCRGQNNIVADSYVIQRHFFNFNDYTVSIVTRWSWMLGGQGSESRSWPIPGFAWRYLEERR
jgi:hypothetical protein